MDSSVSHFSKNHKSLPPVSPRRSFLLRNQMCLMLSRRRSNSLRKEDIMYRNTKMILAVNLLHVLALMLKCCMAFQTATNRYTRHRPNGLSNVTLENIYPFYSTSMSANLVDLSTLCPIGRTEKKVYQIPPYESKLTEVSYMAHSTQFYKGKASVIWIGSDGPQNEIMALDFETGSIIQKYALDVQLQGDWESMSLGPCGSMNTSKKCLYLGDMGNNDARSCADRYCTKGRSKVFIHKLEEPNVNAYYDGKSIKLSTLVISYSSGDFPTNRADSESLFVDHTGDQQGGSPGDIYILTKFPSRYDLQRLGKISVQEHANLAAGSIKAVSMSAVSKLSMSAFEFTDASMNLDGNLIALRDYEKIMFYPRTHLQTVAGALESWACNFTSQTEQLSDQRQYESVTFFSSQRVAEVSECLNELPCTLYMASYRLIFNPTPIHSMPAFQPSAPSVTKPIAPAPKRPASATKPGSPAIAKPKASHLAPKPAPMKKKRYKK